MYEDRSRRFDSDEFFKKFFSILGALIVASAVGLFGLTIVKATLATGEISYCYTTTNHTYGTTLVKLHGFRDWREDRLIGVYPTDEAAINMAQRINCRMGTKR